MAFAYPGGGAPDYAPCRYGASRLTFRGPARPLGPGYAVALGGAETYGKFLTEPFPARLEGLTGRQVVNLGLPGSGPDAFLSDAEVLAMACRAAAVVLQVPGAGNLSNAFYTVHPRRNDRFLRPTEALRTLYPDLDLTEVHFTRHLLHLLHATGPRRFETVAEGLRAAWVDRMGLLLAEIAAPVVLLWMADRPPPPAPHPPDLAAEPLLVDDAMLGAVQGLAAATCEVVLSGPARGTGLAGKAFAPFDRVAAEAAPGPLAHAEVAVALARELDRLIPAPAARGSSG
jgi:hypothetical protein